MMQTTWLKWLGGGRAILLMALAMVLAWPVAVRGTEVNPQVQALFKQAAEAAQAGNLDAAIVDLTQAINLDSQMAPAYYNRGLFYQIKGDAPHAMADLARAIQIDANLAPAYNNLAWIYATNPDASLRNGKKAVELATKACVLTHYTQRGEVDCLAAAYAEAGDFEGAVRWQKTILTMPGLDPDVMEGANARLALYEAHKPYHEKAGAK